VTRTIWVGWETPEGVPYRVRLSVTPGHPGRTYGDPGDCYPPEAAEVIVLDVVEDRPGGEYRPELVGMVTESLDLDDVLSEMDEPDPWPRGDD
jgi:hypothetical protein